MRFVPDPRYQPRVIRHLLDNRRAGAFVGMGLGKSACTLAAFNALHKAKRTPGALIVAPKRVSRITWPNEVAKWENFAHLRIAHLHTPEGMRALERGEADLYLTNFERLPQIVENYFHGRRGNFAFDTLIIDELSKCKNPRSKRVRGGSEHCLRDSDTKELLNAPKRLVRWAASKDRVVEDEQLLVDTLGMKLGSKPVKGLYHYLHKVPRRWGLTGTPMSENLLDLYGQIFLLDDGRRLGRSMTAYTNRWFVRPKRRGADGIVRDSEFDWEARDGAEEEIVRAVSDICLSLRSEDYFDIPPPVFRDEEVRLPATARRDYDELERELLLVLDGKGTVESPTAATLSNKLMQITGGAVFLTDDPDKAWAELHDVKLEALARIRDKHPGEPLLVFSNFTHERKRIAARFPESRQWNDNILADWKAGKVPILSADARSIGHGIDGLQEGGRIVVWFGLPWSRDNYDQSCARLYRRGQTENVIVYRILATDTMDEAVAEALREKGGNQDRFTAALRNLQLLTA